MGGEGGDDGGGGDAGGEAGGDDGGGGGIDGGGADGGEGGEGGADGGGVTGGDGGTKSQQSGTPPEPAQAQPRLLLSSQERVKRTAWQFEKPHVRSVQLVGSAIIRWAQPFWLFRFWGLHA